MIGASRKWLSVLGACWWTACLGSVSCSYRDSKPRTIHAALVDALGAVRPSPGRVSGLRYAPLARTYSPPRSTRGLTAIGLRVRRKAERLPSGRTLGDRAVLDFAAGRIDRAIPDLEEAVRQSPSDARLLSDLAACYLARGDHGEPFFYVKALTLAQRARRADRHRAEVLFNWALTLERNFLNDQASAAWTDYLRFDSDSLWSREATEHLATLEQPSSSEVWSRLRRELDGAALRGDHRAVRRIADAFPYRSRNYAEEELLPGWSEAFVAGRYGEAVRLLKIARSVGQALAAAHGEHIIADAVAAADRALVEQRARELALIERAFAKGRALCLVDRGIEGTASLLGVHEAVLRNQSPIPELEELHLAGCAYARTDYRQVLSLLQGLLRRPAVDRYPALLGRAQWLRGMAYLSLAEPMSSLRSYETAVAVFEKAGAVEEVGALSYIMAGNLRYLGDMPGAWKWLFCGLKETVRSGETRTLYAVFNEFADESSRLGEDEAALLFRSEVVRLAFREGDATGITHALLRFGQAHLNLGHRAQGLKAFVAAERHCIQIDDTYARNRRLADILTVEGKAVGDLRSALPLLSRALDLYHAREDRFPIIDALLARARTFQALGDSEAAERDLLAGVEEFERQRGDLPEESTRISYFEQARDLFDLLIDATARQSGGVEPALGYVERERSRVLLDRLGEFGATPTSAGRAQPLTPAAIRQQIPEGVVLVEYSMLQDRLLLWVLRRGQVQMVISPVAPKSVKTLVERFRLGLEENNPKVDLAALSVGLHAALVAPALRWVRPEDILIFIPDKILHLVPFAALWNSSTRRYLIEDHAIDVAPSATLFLRSLDRERFLGPLPVLDALVVGLPHIDPRRFQKLGQLAWAADELSEVAGFYGGKAEVLTAERATPSAVLARAGDHAVVHLGSHALANENAPALSGLVLTPANEEDAGVLYARDIERASFKRTRLVVLSACDTAAGVRSETEGTLSVARSFLASGVTAVIAALWAVNDKAAVQMSLAFHRNLGSGMSSVAALQEAQISMLKTRGTTNSPAIWASFQHFGGI